jgi:NAD(P)-dependent dehydrogenase (short-subunit alcohol dehydrogenase family)
MTDLTGKVAWVTGAGSGIGRATALALAQAGARVAIGDIGAEGLAETARQIGGDSLELVHDVTDEASWQAGAAAITDRFGRLDVLVNNAGVMMAAPFATAPVAHLRRQYAINVESVFIGMQTAFPLMRQGGSIINVASVYGMVAGAAFAAYSASKGAVRGLSRAAAVEWAKTGVRVNCVLPGPVQTNLGADWDPPVDDQGRPIAPEAALAAWAALIPMGRLGQAHEIAPLIAFLASDAAAFVTGAEFVADGGYTAA